MYSFQKYFDDNMYKEGDDYNMSRAAGFYEQLAKIMYQKLTPKKQREIDAIYEDK